MNVLIENGEYNSPIQITEYKDLADYGPLMITCEANSGLHIDHETELFVEIGRINGTGVQIYNFDPDPIVVTRFPPGDGPVALGVDQEIDHVECSAGCSLWIVPDDENERIIIDELIEIECDDDDLIITVSASALNLDD